MKKIILGLVLILGLSFCGVGIVDALSLEAIGTPRPVTYSESGSTGSSIFIGSSPVEVSNTSSCVDSDGEKNAYVKGTTCIGSFCKTDKCIVSGTPLAGGGYRNKIYLEEYYCGWGKVGYGYPQTEIAEVILQTHTTCPNGCKDGVCLRRPAPSYSEGLRAESEITGGTAVGTQSMLNMIRQAIEKFREALNMLENIVTTYSTT